MFDDFYGSNIATSYGTDTTWTIVSVVLAIVGGLTAYAIFASKENSGEYSGFVAWLHDFLNFKTFFIETILKVLYIICAIFITLNSFSFIRISIADFFMSLIFGNIIARIGFELILMQITLVNNTVEINKKLGNSKKEIPSKTKKKETVQEEPEEK